MLQVSEKTIRRDLANLESQGLIGHEHGLAVLQREIAYSEKSVLNLEAKRAIAYTSANLVHIGDTVFLDAGTTTFEIAKLIADIPDLTMITNDIQIAHYLSQRKGCSVMICGGTIQKETGSISGMFANTMMGYFQIDISFIGAASINDQLLVLTPTVDKVTLKRTILSNSTVTYLVVDDSKFSRKALLKVNSLGDYTGVVTDHCFTERERRLAHKLSVQILPAGSRSERSAH